MTVWAAIGDIQRFAEAKHLVGYAGLGTRVHDSGMTTRTGKITKAGRRDLRVVLVEAAHVAANTHPHWKAELARLRTTPGTQQSHRGDCAQVIGYGLVCAGSAKSGSLRRTRSGCAEDAATLPTKLERKIVRRTNRQRNLCANAWMLWDWAGTDQHSLGLEETDPIAALEIKKGSDVPN